MKTELELRQLRVFLAVIDSGTRTRAARSLGISQSTVSETLGTLERATGTAVFRRSGKGSILTPAGEALVPHARRMLALSSDLVVALTKVTSEVNATLVLSAVESLAAYVLPGPLAVLRERWPMARIEVMTAGCAEIRESVATGKSDLGLTIEMDKSVGAGTVLAAARLLVVGSAAHPLAEQAASTDRLREYDLCVSDLVSDYHQLLKHHFEAERTPLPRLVMMSTVEGVKHGVLAGGTSLGLVPAHAVQKELHAGLLARVNLQPPLPSLVVRAIRSPHSPRSPMVDDFLEFLGESRSLDWTPRAQSPNPPPRRGKRKEKAARVGARPGGSEEGEAQNFTVTRPK